MPSHIFPYPWLQSLQGAAAVDVAADRGILDRLLVSPLPTTGSELLDAVLRDSGVVTILDDHLELTPDFAAAWQSGAGDIKAIASFFRRAASDVATGFDDLAFDLPGFMERAATFRLFRYDLAEGISETHLEGTRPWVNYVEALSRIETPTLTPAIPLNGVLRLLEVGGNTGVMASALLDANPDLKATIYDLPAVCALGEQRNKHPRLSFVAGDARRSDALDEFAGKTDAVLFKSVLHDWPEDEATDMLTRACAVLPPAGRIIVCERQSYDAAVAVDAHTFSIANLVFAPFYRPASFYADWMVSAGLVVQKTEVQLDMSFAITCGLRR